MTKLARKLKSLPQKPGVYLFKDANGEIIYIGKAKVLKNRVKSYFIRSQGHLPRTEIMISLIADLDYVIVSSELESLILENILIKKHKPRFNISLRDDKNYQFIKIDYDLEIPQIYTVHSIPRRDKSQAKYFGPYTSGLSVRNTLNLIKRLFRLCRNKKVGAKPCFAYHLGRCPGVCIGEIKIPEYVKTFKQIENFLKQRQIEVLRDLRREMGESAHARRFEKAAAARDKIRALEHLWERQKIISPKNDMHDYLGIFTAPKEAVINVFLVRGGKLIGQENFSLKHDRAANTKILADFVMQYYTDASDIPQEIFVPERLDQKQMLEKALAKLRGGKVAISEPRRGKKRKLLALSSENAKMFFERELTSIERRIVHVLPDLQALLALPKLPRRIEGYDISNIQGRQPVGSMVVFIDAKPAKSEYRKFKIQTNQTPDDFAMMREMLARRFDHGRIGSKSRSPIRRLADNFQSNPKSQIPNKDRWPLPDLIIIDGGKGQLSTALKAIQATGYKLIPIIGLAKRLEEIFIPGQKQSIILPPNSPILFLLQQIRDEAHRFAVTFHRAKRSKLQTYSRLDEIPGIGPGTRKKLINLFGSVKNVRAADEADLVKAVGARLAKKIREQL